jgi:metal-responsive CopG/Arc/MetJ family transcriptional regulator
MAKKIIQVPVDEVLLKDLDRLSKRQCKARAELIRYACQKYLRLVEQEEMDRIYQQGYKKIPEQSALGDAQISLSGQILSRESW